MYDNEHLEAVLRELHADRVRRTFRWDIAKMVSHFFVMALLGVALNWAVQRGQAAQDARFQAQTDALVRSVNDLVRSVDALWHRVDEISGASVAP